MRGDAVDEVLKRLPYSWTADEAERVGQRFRESRPAAPRRLVKRLWQYWIRMSPDEPLFGDTEDDLALLLHARALGLEAPGGDPGPEDGPIARCARQAAEGAECGPLFPAPPAWGPKAALAPQVRAALPSSLLRAWVAGDDQGPVEVLVVGEGIPEIRQQVVQAALTTCLRVNGLSDPDSGDFVGDHIGVGLIRVTAGLSGAPAQADIPSVFRARSVTVADGASSTARGALRDFVGLLRSLADETSLVEVVDLAYADLLAYAQGLRALADRAAGETDRAFLRAPREEDGGPVSLQPYLRTVRGHGASLGGEFSPDLFTTDAYLRVEQAHQRVLSQRLTMDARLRLDQLETEIEQLTADLEAFHRANEEERRGLWPATVLLVERFDEPTGRTIRLTEPEERETEQYYQVNVPQLISMREKWARRMGELVEQLEAAVHRPHAPARQVAAGRFLDAAVRGVVPDESPATERAFGAWCKEVAPMLRFEWRCALRRHGIAPSDVFTAHSVLISRYLPPAGEDPALLFSHPYTLVDPARSAVLADAERAVMVVRDATDHAEPAPAEATGPTAAALWDGLAELAESPGVEEEFGRRFLEALRAQPEGIARRMIEALQPAGPTAAEADAVEVALRTAERHTSLGEGMDRALMAMRNEAFLTARECLDDIRTAPQWQARVWLLRAIVECRAARLESREIPGLLGHQMPGLPDAALRALDEAGTADEEFTRAWLETLPEAGLDKGIRRLFQGLPRARAGCTGDPLNKVSAEREYAVWLFRRAVENARLARQLDEAGEELAEHQEAVDAALAKLGGALEEILLGPYVGGSRGAAEELFEVLSGQEPPRYGRVAGR
ncbi:hypothetical protein OG879_07955 [Streptomyces caniferus]|uniref:hypothetical protein n=1 Tax=Streptomyces caniferus TaxID=285557 RepID=UPI002E2C884F|nr:hypothetical protein [Streptomyces caniferus]